MREMAASIAGVISAELTRYIHAGTTYVVLACFALAAAAAVFFIGGLVDSDFASLDLLFVFLPVVAICVVPALGARAFAVDDAGRETELWLSLPLSDGELVAGKWLAGCAVLMVALLMTAPIAATVAYLGQPDWGTAAAGMLGAVLLLAAFFAISLLASAVTGQQTAAYLLSVVMFLILCAAGSDALSNIVALPAPVGEALRLVNPRLGLERLATGRIDPATVFAFLALSATALWATVQAIASRRNGAVSAVRGAGLIAAMLGGTALAAVLGGLVLRPLGDIDATSERLYTLSPGTLDIARTAPRGTTIDFYWTAGEAAVPAHIRDHARQLRQMLELLSSRSNGRVTLRVHDAAPDSEADWQAVASGLRRIPLAAGGGFVLGAVIARADRRHVIDYFDVERAGMAEYDLALALSRVGRERVPKVGLLSPLLAPSEMAEPASRFAFLEALRAANDVAVIPFFAGELPDDLDALVVIGEGPLKPSMLTAIDRHVMRGKGLVALLDPLTRLDKTGRMVSRAAGAGLTTVSDLLARYGLTFEANVTGDAHAAALVAAASGKGVPYPFFIAATGGQISATHPASALVRRVLLLEPGSFVLSGNARALVTTSTSAGAAPARALAGSPAENAAVFKADGKPRVLAAVTSGELTSAFRDGNAKDHPAVATNASVVAVADVDWILDEAALAGAQTGGGAAGNDNLVFLGNLVETAAGDRRLAAIRSRTPASRRFTRIADMLAAEQARHQAEETASRLTIEKVENTVAEILKATKARAVADLPADVRQRIGALYAETLPARKRLREIRVEMRQSIERLGFRLTAANLAFGPLAALLLWGSARASRLRWMRSKARLAGAAGETRP